MASTTIQQVLDKKLQPRGVECIHQEVCNRIDFYSNVCGDDISYGCLSTTPEIWLMWSGRFPLSA